MKITYTTKKKKVNPFAMFDKWYIILHNFVSKKYVKKKRLGQFWDLEIILRSHGPWEEFFSTFALSKGAILKYKIIFNKVKDADF